MTGAPPAIRVQGLSKRYRLGEHHGYGSLRESLASGLRSLLGSRPAREKPTIWALRDVSFEVEAGEVVGIIGRNGAGKSTLLKLLSRITEPTAGRAEVRGRIGSLLEVGTGFHPELTGRENVFLNGAILGMRRVEILSKLDEIIAFAEVEDFVDTPVKRYSSGMYLRLAFSVAAHLEPDILLVDEVLAVGDVEFQKRCLGKMGEIGESGRTVLVVSHNMASIANLCERAMLLEAGRIARLGAATEVVHHYVADARSHAGERLWPDTADAPGNDTVRLQSVRVLQDGIDGATADVDIAREIRIEIGYRCLEEGAPLYTALWLRDKIGTPVLASGNATPVSLTEDPWYGKPHPRGRYRSVCRIPGSFLNDSLYSITAILGRAPNRTLVLEDAALSFMVHDSGEMRREYYGEWLGVVRPKLAWGTEPVGETPEDGIHEP
jgi:lipopolysaccharide transport system ATP-binding protein